MSVGQPRDESGQFQSPPRVSHSGTRVVQLSEFEARLIANRLWEAADWYEDNTTGTQISGSCRWWSNRISEQCKTQDDYSPHGKKRHLSCDYTISVEISEFEAKFIGNRLWEVGDRYERIDEDNVADETKWWARRFHAESGELGN